MSSLPINEVGYTHETTLPSTGETVNFRPYLVKEEKMLLMAAETQDRVEALNAMGRIIADCYEDVNINKITMFDLEHLFIKLRAMSVGESVEVKYACGSCDAPNKQELDLGQVDHGVDPVEFLESHRYIDINETTKIELAYPTFKSIMANPELAKPEDDIKKTVIAFDMIDASIKVIHMGEELLSFHDFTRAERDKFVGNLTPGIRKQLQAFFEDGPSMKILHTFECKECGHKNEIEVKGAQLFFG